MKDKTLRDLYFHGMESLAGAGGLNRSGVEIGR